jgi:hypothetical protein
MSKIIVMNILADRPIAYHPDIARVAGGIKAGIFLSQLLYWSDKGKRLDGYIWKTQEDWETETALTRKEQEGARRELKSRGLLDEKLQGIPAKLYYKIDTDQLYTLLNDLYVQTSMSQTGIQDDPKGTNSDAPEGHTNTESTRDEPKENIMAAVLAYENTFGTITYTASAKLNDDIDTYGETAVLNALAIANGKQAHTYGYVEKILKNAANEKESKRAGQNLWVDEVEPYQQHRIAWADLSPIAQKAIRAIGGQSALRDAKIGYELEAIKKQVMSYAQ